MKKFIRAAALALVVLAPVAANAGVIFAGKAIIITPNPGSRSHQSPTPSSPSQGSTPQSPIELLTQLSGMGIPAVCIPTLAESDDAYRNCSRKYARAALVSASAIYMNEYERDYSSSSNRADRPDFHGCYADWNGRTAQMTVHNGYPPEDCDIEARLNLELQLIYALIEVKAFE